MPRRDGLGFLGIFFKKAVFEIWDWMKRVGIRIWIGTVQLFAAGWACVCWVSELRADAGRTVSIVKIVSLSPRVENLKVKKVIKVSYLNYRESSVFRVFFGIPYVYFTYSYLGPILNMLHKENTQSKPVKLHFQINSVMHPALMDLVGEYML